MPNTNDFKAIAASGGANVDSQATFLALISTIIANGFTSGVVPSTTFNKVLRQSTVIAAMIGQYINDLAALDALDNGDTATLLANYKAAVAAHAAATIKVRAPIQPITATVAANALTLTLAATILDFRSSPLTSGTINTRTVAAPVSLVVPSGASLGTVNGQSARLALLAIDNAGTVELAVANLAGGVNLDETTLISTTAISAAATSASVVYSATARSNVPFRVVGFIDIAEAAAGTWATAPSTVQGAGGNAMAAMQSIGYGQTWQNVSGSRAANTTYYNTTGRPILVSMSNGNSAAGLTATVNGVTAATMPSGGGSGSGCYCSFVVPPGASYSINSSGTWSELR
jgi:hypothetical protein